MLTLQLYKDLRSWSNRDPKGSKTEIKKLNLHTNYLCRSLVIFSFGSDKVSNDIKDKMTKKLKEIERPSEFSAGKPDVR